MSDERRNYLSPIGRVSYSYVFTPRQRPGKKPAYEITLLFPKGSTPLATIEAAVREAVAGKWGSKSPDINPVIQDGDTKTWAGYPGHWFVRFRSTFPPGVVDQRMGLITEESQRFYDGCWARVSFTTYAYDAKDGGKPGIQLQIVNIQKARDDEPLGGGDPAADFDELPIDNEPMSDDVAGMFQ